MSIQDLDPNPLFVDFPDDNDIADVLDDLDLESCVGDTCSPGRCNSMTLMGELEMSERADVAGAVKEAYSEANPGLSAADFDVDVIGVAGGLSDEDGWATTAFVSLEGIINNSFGIRGKRCQIQQEYIQTYWIAMCWKIAQNIYL